MSEIARDERQITFFYNPQSSIGKQALAYIQESEIPILVVDLLKNPPTGSHWIEIADQLGMEVSELVLKEHPVYKSQYNDVSLSVHDWLKIMHRHPEVIDQPIAIRGDVTLLVRTPTEVLQLLKQDKTNQE